MKLAAAALVLATTGATVPTWWGAGPVTAADAPTHTLTVSGTGVGMYPAYDASVRRYAATTTDATFPGNDVDNTQNTGGALTVQATTSDPGGTVLVNGAPISEGETTIAGLSAGDEVSVIYVDAAGREADSVIVLPAEFPTMSATIAEPGITPGLVGITLSQWAGNGWPNFEAVVDRHGVPAWVRSSVDGGLDLKRQPDGHYTEARGPAAGGQDLGSNQIVQLDNQFRPVAGYHTHLPLTHTDGHDSILEDDGSRVLLAYQPNADTGLTDAVIQEVDAQGNVTFQWDSSALAGESVRTGAADYAHINSVDIVNGGQDFLASFRHLSSVLLIARQAHDGYQPRDVVWKLGGRDSSFDFVDDPYGGPCAQHSARELPDGDIMIFDNGSISGFGKMCVDQANPTGPTFERPHSRLAVYHLDPVAHTATLVRSYGPAGWFSWFMGSTQYLPETGNILIGWAAATQAVATELGPQNTPVWELVAAQSSNGRNYLSYRSTKFDVPDATPPDVTVTTPVDGATFAFQQQVTSDFGCTDRGGANLVTCGTQAPGGLLDTTTAGQHTFSVTALDGAGNVTTVTRHYVVGPGPATPPPTTPTPTAPAPSAPAYRPDAAVRRGDGSWLGVGVFSGAGSQQLRRGLFRSAGEQRLVFGLGNRGTRTDRCLVEGSASNQRLRVSWWFGGEDVTRPVTRGTWRSPATQPGARQRLQLRVEAGPLASPGDRVSASLSCTSTHEALVQDAAGVRFRVR